MLDKTFDKILTHLQLKGTLAFPDLQESLLVHPGYLHYILEVARIKGLVRKLEDGSGCSWQLTDAGRKYCNLRAVASKAENRPKEESGQLIMLDSNNHGLGGYNSFHEAEAQARIFASKSPGKT